HPNTLPHFSDLGSEEFEAAYSKAEGEGLLMQQVQARELYAKMMRTMAQTGNGWMTFKDAANRKSNQTARPENVVHLSILCTEIMWWRAGKTPPSATSARSTPPVT